MPIHVFRCEACGEKFERLLKLSAADPDTCPHCGVQHRVRRQVSAPAFRLAGSGWYETDFKSARERKHNLAGDGGAPKADSAAKPADGPASKPAAADKPASTDKPAAATGD